ncbi:4-hydroxyphenylpyruvate dioxygenase [Lentzea flava]|uniref:4-hydroxyphenylpyruvate dioxygenase n=1 Tax=Lentzea flava TaxID=103732 RepID=A0ABQ2UGL2_9PSEU|nr:4-hydroxyphenylpyruvate dioxygenase [Lentzea flava]MCP2198976.1 4-hydroxymandelate synthase [Lentzea flava]GGU32535.1 4-hydroxyphenylpyruvate dioxygenase [Lentzea flava]
MLYNDLTMGHVEFYVADIAVPLAELVDGYGFEVLGSVTTPSHTSTAVGQGEIVFVLTQPHDDDHPASLYVARHGDGVANIVLRTSDARGAFTSAVSAGAHPVVVPKESAGVVSAVIGAFGDVVHTFLQAPEGFIPGFGTLPTPAPREDGLLALDHFAVCLEAGDLAPAVEFYESVLGFSAIFEERIAVGDQAMNSKAVQSASGTVTFTLIEPDTTAKPGQIDDFLKDHGGAGVQHIAFTSKNIVRAVSDLNRRGVRFLDPPKTYYRMLSDRLELVRHTADDLEPLGILVDADHDGHLFQIFTRSTHPRRTLFFEVIERLHAQTFGSGNVQALYQAVEMERITAQEQL